MVRLIVEFKKLPALFSALTVVDDPDTPEGNYWAIHKAELMMRMFILDLHGTADDAKREELKHLFEEDSILSEKFEELEAEFETMQRAYGMRLKSAKDIRILASDGSALITMN